MTMQHDGTIFIDVFIKYTCDIYRFLMKTKAPAVSILILPSEDSGGIHG
jgi:hypothetical protein